MFSLLDWHYVTTRVLEKYHRVDAYTIINGRVRLFVALKLA